MTNFEFSTATRVVFGSGLAHSQLGKLAAELGTRAFVVTGRSTLIADGLLNELPTSSHKKVTIEGRFSVGREPTIEDARLATLQAREARCDLVIGIGGGSAIDLAKAVAALITNEGDPMDYIEVVGKGLPLTKPALPIIAVPTTSGAGSEVTKNAVLCSKQHRVKASLRSLTMLPRVALVDPSLTLSVPPSTTANTGLDAFCQAQESFVSNMANPLTDSLCREALRKASTSLRLAYHNGSNIEGREGMSLCALFAGMALANSKLGTVHGFAGVIGGMYDDAPHGAICAALLPNIMRHNINKLKSTVDSLTEKQISSLEKYEETARIITHNNEATALDGVDWVDQLCKELGIQSLRHYGVQEADLQKIAELTSVASSTKGNPITFTIEELVTILKEAL